MLSLLFNNDLHKELGLEKNIEYPYKKGVTISVIMNDLGICNSKLGLITIDGMCVLPSDPVDNNKTIVFHPYVIGG